MVMSLENSLNCIIFGDLTLQNRHLCLEMASHKYNVAFNYSDVTEEFLEPLVKKIKEYGVEVIAYNTETDNTDGVKNMMQTVKDTWKTISVLINSCDYQKSNSLLDVSYEDFNKLVAYNLSSIYQSSKSILQAMIFKRRGTIINISSSYGFKVSTNIGSAYAATKAGIVGFTRSLAKEVARYGITVNTLLLKEIGEDINYSEHMDLEEVTKQEIAKDIYQICHCSKNITGQVIGLDSGYTDFMF